MGSADSDVFAKGRAALVPVQQLAAHEVRMEAAVFACQAPRSGAGEAADGPGDEVQARRR
jgi:hypothetical protein